MEALPEVLRVAVSEALTSGKKLSWSVWDNGEITSVKLLWKPDVSSPVQSEIPPRPAAASTLHLRPRHNVKKKRSPSSWRRSNQRLKSFLEKQNGQERQECGTVVIGESQEMIQLLQVLLCYSYVIVVCKHLHMYRCVYSNSNKGPIRWDIQ